MRRSLAFRLVWLTAAAATLPGLVLTVAFRSISSRVIATGIQRQQTELARRVANEVNDEIRHAQEMLAFTARSPWVLTTNLAQIQRSMQNLVHIVSPFQEVSLVSGSGDEIIHMSRRGMEPRSHRTENIQTRMIGSPFFSGNRLPTILMTEPIVAPPGLPQGRALIAKLSFSSLGSMMQQTSLSLHAHAFIVDQHGSLLAHPDIGRVRAHDNLTKSAIVQDWMRYPFQPTRLYQYRDENGVPSLAVAYPIPLLRSAVIIEQPRTDVYAPLERMRDQFLLFTVLFLIVFIGLTVAIAWRILQPLRQLRQAADQIAHGQMDVQLDIHTNDELEELGKAFSKMAESLRALETMRRDLISMVVHDLKSPLSSILASMDYCLTGQIGALNAEQKKFLTVGYRSGHDLLLLIDNLLDVARMEEGKLSLRKEVIDPGLWMQEIINAFQPIAEGARKHLQLTPTPDLSPVEGDRTLLRRVMENLISNALRHTEADTGIVLVTLRPQGDKLSIDVHDNGAGIAPEDQERIFEKFVQVHAKRARVRTGTGLGLTFCKMVVEAHGGRISVQSVPGQGSTFTVTLNAISALKAGDFTDDPFIVVSTSRN